MSVFRANLTTTPPRDVAGVGGPITVGRVPTLRSREGHELCGEWSQSTRHIAIASTLDRRLAWVTFWHEMMHSWLEDTGQVHLFSMDQQEALCELVGLGLTRMMEGQS